MFLKQIFGNHPELERVLKGPTSLLRVFKQIFHYMYFMCSVLQGLFQKSIILFTYILVKLEYCNIFNLTVEYIIERTFVGKFY